MAITIPPFNPSSTILATDKISQTDDKLRTILSEAGQYVETQSQAIEDDLQTQFNTLNGEALDIANKSLINSNYAKDTAESAKADTTGFQAQLDNLTSGGDTTYNTAYIDHSFRRMKYRQAFKLNLLGA